jgi:hypothetical protein
MPTLLLAKAVKKLSSALILLKHLIGRAVIFMANDILTAKELVIIWNRNDDSFSMMQDAARLGFEKGRIAETEKNDKELAAVNCACNSSRKLRNEDAK